jgi:LysR family transcriptional regulator, glycine cleavage system transcriptional activator
MRGMSRAHGVLSRNCTMPTQMQMQMQMQMRSLCTPCIIFRDGGRYEFSVCISPAPRQGFVPMQGMSRAHGIDLARGVPLESLRGFEAAGRLLNFTRAAEELHVTQSAVSREIRTLEERLQTQLFERVAGGLRLTSSGSALHKEVELGLALLRKGLERASSVGRRRTLVVAVTRPLGSEWLAEKLPEFIDHHPDIDVRISILPRTSATTDWQAMDGLPPIDADVSIRLMPRVAGDGRLPLLLTEYVFPCCSKALAAERRRRIRSLDDLSQHRLIEYDDGLPGLDRLDANWPVWWPAMGVPPVIPSQWVRIPDWAMVKRLGTLGCGVFLGRTPLINSQLRDGTLVAPTGSATVSTRAYYLSQSQKSLTNPDLQTFVEWLLAKAQQEQQCSREWVRGSTIGGTPEDPAAAQEKGKRA